MFVSSGFTNANLQSGYHLFVISNFKFENLNLKIINKNLEFAILFCNFANIKINANRYIMEENFATRLKLFMESIGMPSSQFADLCEIPRPSFSQLLSGRNQKVSDVLIKKIHSVFPQLSIMWLMFGEGKMTEEKSAEDDKDEASSKKTSETGKNPAENSELSADRTVNAGYSNLRGLNIPDQQTQNSIFQHLEDNKKILELQMQIESLQKNLRRVAQITVFYDDSSFETFVPAK
ncbi:MAG: hypothetical protein NC311_16310 [Muribaculaceae bacterium]|nr:hypothetical protein [Muribaculaceae bacterium]